MNLVNNDRNHPKELFSTNNTGILWEEASGAIYSGGILARWVRLSWWLNILLTLFWVSAVAAVLDLVLLLVIVADKFHVNTATRNIVGVSFPVLCILFFMLLFIYCYASRGKDRDEYMALGKDGEGYWEPIDPSIGYTNLSLPMIVRNRRGIFLCVYPEYLWDSACETMEQYFTFEGHGAPCSLWKVPIPSEVMFSTPERQQEFLSSKNDTQVRFLTARVVYATQQVEWLDRLAFEKAPEIVVDEQGWLLPAVLDDYRACKNWYEKYRDENIAVLHGVIEKKLADRKSVEQQKLARENIVREKMGITV